MAIWYVLFVIYLSSALITQWKKDDLTKAIENEGLVDADEYTLSIASQVLVFVPILNTLTAIIIIKGIIRGKF